MDPSLAHVQYMHPSSLTGNINQLAGDSFVAPDQDDRDHRRGGLTIWQAKYRFQQNMLPMFVGEAFGRKVNKPFSITSSLFQNVT